MTLVVGFDGAGGDVVEFDALYVTVAPRPLCCSHAIVGGDAEDVASQGWLQLVRDLPALRDSRGFRDWAAAIARHRAVGRLRHYRRRRAVPTAMDELMELPAQYRVGDVAVESVSTDTSLVLIASLPPDQAEAVLLRVVACLGVNATAAVLGKRPGAVGVAVYRGLRRLAPNSASNQNVPVDHS